MSDSYDFEVVQEPLFNRDGKAALIGKSPVMGNFRTDTGQCLGTSTEKYAIVQMAHWSSRLRTRSVR